MTLTCWDWLALAVTVDEIDFREPNYYTESLKQRKIVRTLDGRCATRGSTAPSSSALTSLRRQIQTAHLKPYSVAGRVLRGWGSGDRERFDSAYEMIEVDVIVHPRAFPRIQIMVTWRQDWDYWGGSTGRPQRRSLMPAYPLTLQIPLDEVRVCLDYLEENP
jgi:hypothetical protein